MTKTMKKTIKPAMLLLLAAVMVVSAFTARAFGAGFSLVPAASAAASGSGASLSLVEINNSFGVMVLRRTDYKTLIYVDRLYFEYSPLSTKRLALTPNSVRKTGDMAGNYVMIDVENEAGEWVKTWGCVRQEEGVRPDDPLKRIMTLYYLEIGFYWEWRTFTNEERWKVKVNDGIVTVDLTFDMADRKDGAVYHVDGVYGLPEHYYPQVMHWWEINEEDNPDWVELRNEYLALSAAAAAATPEGEPLRLDAVEYTGGLANRAAPASMTGSDQAAPVLFPVVPIVMITVAVIAVTALVGAVTKKTAAPAPDPGQPQDTNDNRTENNPPAPTDPQKDWYNKYLEDNPVPLELRAELEKHKEFAPDNDVPAGQKVVKLKVKDDDGVFQSVYDENGDEVYLNRKTYTVGNATFALINRKNNLLIRYMPDTMSLCDMVGNKITVNSENRIMNMDGVQPFSFRSQEDVIRKLGDMGVYTTAIKVERFLYRMDDPDVLRKAMTFKTNDVKKPFFETLGDALKNLFGGGGSSASKSFLSKFLDVLILIGVVILGLGALFAVAAAVGAMKKAKDG